MTANNAATLFFVILSENGLDANIADFTGDEDTLQMPKDEDASYRYDVNDSWEKDADVDENLILRDEHGVFIFSSRSAALNTAIEHLENNIEAVVKANISRLRVERKKCLPRVVKRRPAARTAN